MKPIQAVPVVETGAVDFFQFSDADLSLCCASHSGEPMHTDRALAILKSLGLEEEALQCGTLIPRWQETYYKLDHPVQQRILQTVNEICDYPSEEIEIGMDGCGVPVHGLPLQALAHGYTKMTKPEEMGWAETRVKAVKRVSDAKIAAPEMVGGTGRFCTDFIKAGKGRFFGKAGAEAVYCIGDKETGIGIALKIEDGNGRAMYPAAVEVLRQLSLIDDKQTEELMNYYRPKLRNARDEVIGELNPVFTLSAGS
ncbi:L-asparaginase II [Evansella vedderi]|uniref:L-asparaginase II n=2 Tax=Evansella vedderi TaxID=38282 RepID=A0ABT9ZSE0_9BACI|nr:L-asparaginase II [Evansella vedderi]